MKNNITYTTLKELNIPLLRPILEQSFIYKFSNDISVHYPEFESWFNTKVYCDPDREYICAFNTDNHVCTLVGLCLLKKSENKICTLYVHQDYRHQGIATELIRLAQIELNECKVWLTIPKELLPSYQGIIWYVGFEVEELETEYKLTKD